VEFLIGVVSGVDPGQRHDRLLRVDDRRLLVVDDRTLLALVREDAGDAFGNGPTEGRLQIRMIDSH